VCCGVAFAAPLGAVGSLVVVPLGLGDFAAAVFVAPIVEEVAKLFVAVRIAGKRRFLVMPAALCVAAGFGFIEDALYLTSSTDMSEYVTTMVLRCGITPLLHPAFSCVAALGHQRRRTRVLALVAAMLLHALWNYHASEYSVFATFLLLAVAMSAIPLLLVISETRRQRSQLRQWVGSLEFDPAVIAVALEPRARASVAHLQPVNQAVARAWATTAAETALGHRTISDEELLAQAAEWEWSPPVPASAAQAR
jgi:hypothetical protein